MPSIVIRNPHDTWDAAGPLRAKAMAEVMALQSLEPGDPARLICLLAASLPALSPAAFLLQLPGLQFKGRQIIMGSGKCIRLGPVGTYEAARHPMV